MGDPMSNAAMVEECPIIRFWYVMASDSADLSLPLSKDLGAPDCDTVSDVMTLVRCYDSRTNQCYACTFNVPPLHTSTHSAVRDPPAAESLHKVLDPFSFVTVW